MTNNGIIQHPSTPEHEIDPRFPAELALKKSLPDLLAILTDFGFDCRSDEFQKDFHIVVEILRALLYAQLGIYHDVQTGLSTQKDAPTE
jgi:hypothetical protein